MYIVVGIVYMLLQFIGDTFLKQTYKLGFDILGKKLTILMQAHWHHWMAMAFLHKEFHKSQWISKQRIIQEKASEYNQTLKATNLDDGFKIIFFFCLLN